MVIQCVGCGHGFFVPDASFKYGMPTVKCPRCSTRFKPVLNNSDEMLKEKTAMHEGNVYKHRTARGWLVVHDEITAPQTFELKPGKQLIGRKSESRPCEIMIDTVDKFMSRHHFYIEIREIQTGVFEYILSDAESANHTFINAHNLHKVKRNDQYLLKDNDIIQAGMTKIVFKSDVEVKSKQSATMLVTSKPKGKTVKIN